ncbi:proliferating cell nuclear antigen-like [Triticum dicoccoides]|uniref:proliferating cell nuclear antigen-like n=1 Tax=Triticum dicoccoides TaxID=85692 RepID=UPI00188FA046|nr:proliferating cell nuclear antigen-like [Triticum dicoccoides]
MFELKMVKGSTLQGVLEAILDLVNVANVDCSSEGFSLQALDTEHVVFLSLFFPSEVFRSYRCDEDCSMGIAIADMVDLLRASNDGDIITIKVTDQNFEDITLTFESPDEAKTTDMDLQLVYVDAPSHRLKISEWHDMESEYQAIFCMPSAQFMLNCKSLSVIGDDAVVVIRVNEEVISFSTKGKRRCVNISHVLNKTDKHVTLTHARGPVSLALNLRYMKSCAKVSTLFDQVKIGLSTTLPLMVECKIAEKGYIRYFVATKNLTEEEEGKTETEEAEGEEGRQRKKAKKK